MYKDRAKQREVERERQRRYRAKGVTKQSVTGQGVTSTIAGSMQDGYYEKVKQAKPKRSKDIKCFADLPPDVELARYLTRE